jgi:hypothetical protein
MKIAQYRLPKDDVDLNAVEPSGYVARHLVTHKVDITIYKLRLKKFL